MQRSQFPAGSEGCHGLGLHGCSVPQFPHPGGAPVVTSLLSVPFPEINNGVETTDELSFCSENGYANEMVTPTDHRDTKLRIN